MTCVAISPDNEYILTCGNDTYVNLISMSTFEIIRKLNFRNQKPVSLSFASSNHVVCALPSELRVYTLNNGLLNVILSSPVMTREKIRRVFVDEHHQLYVFFKISSAAHVYNLKKILTLVRTKRLMSMANFEFLRINPSATLLSGCIYNRLIVNYNLKENRECARYFLPHVILSLQWRSDDTLAACCSDGMIYLVDGDKQGEIIELKLMEDSVDEGNPIYKPPEEGGETQDLSTRGPRSISLTRQKMEVEMQKIDFDPPSPMSPQKKDSSGRESLANIKRKTGPVSGEAKRGRRNVIRGEKICEKGKTFGTKDARELVEIYNFEIFPFRDLRHGQ